MPTAPPPRPLIVALEGPSGVGKTTVARRLARLLGGTVVDESYARLSPMPSLSPPSARALVALERRLLSEEGRRWAATRQIVARGRPAILDTGLAGPFTYVDAWVREGSGWDTRRSVAQRLIADWRRGRRRLPDAIVYLDAPLSALSARARRDPAHHPAAEWRRHTRLARYERGFWRELGVLLPPGRLIFVRAVKTPEQLARSIARRLTAHPPRRSSAGEAAAFLAHVDRRARAIVKSRSPSRRPFR